jgi:hypothetical protein
LSSYDDTATRFVSQSADPRAFISFDFDHNQTGKILFVGQAKSPKTPFSIQDWSAKSSMPQSQWEAIVKEKINKCNVLIVLVGKAMASAFGIAKEIKMAKGQNVPLFGIYVGGADTSTVVSLILKSWEANSALNPYSSAWSQGPIGLYVRLKATGGHLVPSPQVSWPRCSSRFFAWHYMQLLNWPMAPIK